MNMKNNIKTVPKSLLPTVFEFSIGPDICHNYHVTWLPDHEMLELRLMGFGNIGEIDPGSDDPYLKHVKVTASQWRVFWAMLNYIKAWSWEQSYWNADVLDGTSWRLKIKYRSKNLESHGTNAYPESEELDLKSDSSFELFIDALNILLGDDYIPEKDFY